MPEVQLLRIVERGLAEIIDLKDEDLLLHRLNYNHPFQNLSTITAGELVDSGDLSNVEVYGLQYCVHLESQVRILRYRVLPGVRELQITRWTEASYVVAYPHSEGREPTWFNRLRPALEYADFDIEAFEALPRRKAKI